MDARLLAVAEHQSGVFTASDAARVDVGESALRHLTRNHEILHLRRGAYVLASRWDPASPEQRLALRTCAVLRTRPTPVDDVSDTAYGTIAPEAACHQSSLALHDLPLHGVRADIVDVMSKVSRVRLSSGLRTQPGSHPTVTVQGVRAVTIPVAIAQVLQRCGVLAALVPLDAALRGKKCTVKEVSAALVAVLGAGSSRGARLLELADPKSDSVGETRTRLLLHDLGYDVLSQISIVDDHDRFVGRVDFLVNKRIIVEFDGLQKYAGASGKAALAQEKRREDRLRALGYMVVRLVWADLDHPERIAAMMRRAVQQAERAAG